ncbi:MAG: zinc ribbon domain-containing protein, partial [Planctomycetota bacterium]|nr:zinc ribbon domain-containing protein [Planctomycetota bacterium]
MSDQVLFCPKCGARQIKADARFCHQCGAQIIAPPAPAVSASESIPLMSDRPQRPAKGRGAILIGLLVVLLSLVAFMAVIWLTPLRENLLAWLPSGALTATPPPPTGRPASRSGADDLSGGQLTTTSTASWTATSTAVSPTLTVTPLPTATPQPTASAPPTATPIPTATPLPTATSSPTTTPRPTATPQAVAQFTSIGLQAIANASTTSGYVNPPLGNVTLGGIPFNLGQGQSVTTQAGPLPNNPTRVVLPVDVAGPQAVYLLLTGGDLYVRFAGSLVGQVRLAFADGREHRVDLVAGQNIREWKHYDANVISRASSPDLAEVWRGGNKDDSGAAIIDMLKITLPADLRGGRLTAIEILDRSAETVGDLDPALNLLGATVAAVQAAQATPTVQQCAVETAAKFRSLWQQYRAALGCPRGQLVEDGGATERFQRGRMIWRKDNDMIYVLYDEGDGLGTPETSVDGAPEPGGFQPPAGLLAPVRGFGVTWRERLGGQSARIGWATEQEYWLPMQFEDFERGLMFEMDNKIYLLGEDGRHWLTP